MSPAAGQTRQRNYDRGMESYVEVADRIQRFYAKYPDGAIVTESVDFHVDEYVYITLESNGQKREVPGLKGWVLVKAKAYRSPDDRHPGTGWSQLIMPGGTPYTRGSELENCETSAWGRAVAAVGIEVREGIASAQELRQKMEEDAQQTTVNITASNQPQAERGGYVPNATNSQITSIGGLAREMGMETGKLWDLICELNPQVDKALIPPDMDEKEATRVIKSTLKELDANKAGEIIVTLMALQASGGELVKDEPTEGFEGVTDAG